jgi:hypothetical protein
MFLLSVECSATTTIQILLPSAVHLEETLTVSQQSVKQASSQSDSQLGKQAGRQKHTVWVFSVADSDTSSGESSNCQNKQLVKW